MDSERTGEASNDVVDDMCLDVIAQKPPLDFDSWVSLIAHVEKLHYDDENRISSIYDSFLSEFPLCYGYWRKYAAHMIRLSTFDKIIQVFERAVLAVTHTVGVWLDYCVCCISLFPDPNNIRRQFKRGLTHVGRDYLCYSLWDKYIEYEFSQQNWSALAYIYIQILRYPKKMLGDYYNRFTQLVAMFKEEMERQGTFTAEIDSVLDNELPVAYTDDEILAIIKDLLDDSDTLSKTKAWQKYKLIGESLHRNSCSLDEKIHCFEDQIHRTYFHVIPLDNKELETWHQYLDFVEEQGDFDWKVKLYERCLIPCARYTDIWIRYVLLLENDGGRELANFALDRATTTFLKTVPSIHLFNARYKEKIKDFHGARTSFPKFDREDLHPNFITNVIEQANMERRLGDYEAAYRIYREAIELTTERKKLNMLSCLYINYSRLTYKATKSVGAALGILADGIKQIPYCKLLLKELIKFGMMHGEPKDMNVVDSIISNALTSKDIPSFSSKEKESMSLFYLKFVDLCGSIDDLMKAWARHIKLFPHSVRTAFSGEPPYARESGKVTASKSIKLCIDVDPSTCSPSTLDKPDLLVENQTEHGKQNRLEGVEYARDVLENGSVPSPNNVASALSADYIHNTDAMGNTNDSTKLGDLHHVEGHGDESNLNTLAFGIIVENNGDKGPPNATTTMDNVYSDLEDVSREKTEENFPSAKCDRLLPNSLQDLQLSEPHVGASSNTEHGVRGNCSNDDQKRLQRSLSPTSAPRSVSNHVPKSSGDPALTCNENSTQHFPETALDWQHQRRPDRFIKDPNSKLRPNRQRRPSPPRNYRSDSDHIITIQRNATQPMPKRNLPVQDNPVQYQQPWSSTPPTAMGYSWPMQNMQHSIPAASQSQVASQTVNQASVQMPNYAIQVGIQSGQVQNQQAYDQMTQNYFYQQQVPIQQQQLPQQIQITPEQWQQQQQYWMQLQYQQQLGQQIPIQMQQQEQVPLQMQLQEQVPLQMQQQQAQVLVPLQMQQQAQVPVPLQMQLKDQPGSQAPLLHQQQLQLLLELQHQRKQQQLQQLHQEPQPQPQQEMFQMQQQPAPSSSEN